MVPLLAGMSEEAARALLSLSQSIAEDKNRTKIVEQMSVKLNKQCHFNEASTDDRRIREHGAAQCQHTATAD